MKKLTQTALVSTPDTHNLSNRDLFALGIVREEFGGRDLSLARPHRDRTPQEVEQARVTMRRRNSTRRDRIFEQQTELLRARLAELDRGAT